MPHGRCLRQPALRLWTAARRGDRAPQHGRWIPALPAPGRAGDRPVRKARGVRVAGRRPGHLRGERGPRSRRGRARLHGRGADAACPERRPGRPAHQQPRQDQAAAPAGHHRDRCRTHGSAPVALQRGIPCRQGPAGRTHAEASVSALIVADSTVDNGAGPGDGRDLPMPAAEPTAPARWRRLAGRVLTLLAGLLVLTVLVAPSGSPNPVALLRIPVEALVGVAVVLLLPPRPRRIALVPGAVGLGALAVV